jgi:hypothetical protein
MVKMSMTGDEKLGYMSASVEALKLVVGELKTAVEGGFKSIADKMETFARELQDVENLNKNELQHVKENLEKQIVDNYNELNNKITKAFEKIDLLAALPAKKALADAESRKKIFTNAIIGLAAAGVFSFITALIVGYVQSGGAFK